jgi:hypothetical protein
MPEDRAMTPKSRFDKLLAYLKDRSRLNQNEIAHIQDALGDLKIDHHKQTAIKIMDSGVFSGQKFKRKTGAKGSAYIDDFEKFIAKVAAAIDGHTHELQNRLAKTEYTSTNLTEKMTLCIKQFYRLEQELSKIKWINSKRLVNVRKSLEKFKIDLLKGLSGFQTVKTEHRVRAKIPHHLLEKLINLIREHSPELPDVAMAEVLVKMLDEFCPKLSEHSIRKKIQSLAKIVSPH